MTPRQFEQLSADLRRLAGTAPLRWGRVQNNHDDRTLNLFRIASYQELKSAVASLDAPMQAYFERRWFVWQCARCDEYLFALNDNVTPNPNSRDKNYDLLFNDKWTFDLKGTVVPAAMHGQVEQLIENPQPMIDFFFRKQSRGVRLSFQNRLFIVHHSFIDPSRECFLRCAWQSKQHIYAEYCKMIASGKRFFSFNDRCLADVIFIMERERGKTEWNIYH
ncbi:MAG: hypothetical protein LBS16_07390 [Prevotellaceae bacterium]|jgi:hypothetical protein|nr:hypothetical protein [Prevotellaceae bacterium]